VAKAFTRMTNIPKKPKTFYSGENAPDSWKQHLVFTNDAPYATVIRQSSDPEIVETIFPYFSITLRRYCRMTVAPGASFVKTGCCCQLTGAASPENSLRFLERFGTRADAFVTPAPTSLPGRSMVGRAPKGPVHQRL